jgi:hypothetical protein
VDRKKGLCSDPKLNRSKQPRIQCSSIHGKLHAVTNTSANSCVQSACCTTAFNEDNGACQEFTCLRLPNRDEEDDLPNNAVYHDEATFRVCVMK